MVNDDKLLLLGCGILKREVRWLIDKNHWPLEMFMMASSLHSDFDKLERGLRGALDKHKTRDTIVFYGCCHPRMEEILEEHSTFRTEGQNCVEMVLGKELFNEELLKGAFFLFEDWALHWEQMMAVTFGSHVEVMREIFRVDRKYILALRTPASGDFSAAAATMADQVGLPLRWRDVGLEHLEAVMQVAVDRKLMEKT